jgi:hypothetical protein
MPESTNEPPDPNLPDTETAFGGADAVEKTTYVVGRGTDPNALSPKGHPPKTGNLGLNWVGWVVLAGAVIIAAIYMLGIRGR